MFKKTLKDAGMLNVMFESHIPYVIGKKAPDAKKPLGRG